MASFSLNEKWFKLSYRCLYFSVAVLSCLQESVTLTVIIQPIINNEINQVNKRLCPIGRNRSTIRRNNQFFHDTNVVHFWFRGRSLHARKSSGYNRCNVSDFNSGLGKAKLSRLVFTIWKWHGKRVVFFTASSLCIASLLSCGSVYKAMEPC